MNDNKTNADYNRTRIEVAADKRIYRNHSTIEYVSGDMFSYKADALVNPVNTVGVMGKGLALAFKKKFPNNFALYKKACDEKQVVVGKMFTTINTDSNRPKYIINFPTKEHWINSSNIEWIKTGLIDLRRLIITSDIRSIVIPALGCGNGGLNWHDVNYYIYNILEGLDKCNVMVCKPN